MTHEKPSAAREYRVGIDLAGPDSDHTTVALFSRHENGWFYEAMMRARQEPSGDWRVRWMGPGPCPDCGDRSEHEHSILRSA